MGDATFVTVEDAGDESRAGPSAREYRASFGKVAHFKGTMTHRHGRYVNSIDVTFDCVAAN